MKWSRSIGRSIEVIAIVEKTFLKSRWLYTTIIPEPNISCSIMRQEPSWLFIERHHLEKPLFLFFAGWTTIKSNWDRKQSMWAVGNEKNRWLKKNLNISAGKWSSRGDWPPGSWPSMVNLSQGHCPWGWPLVLAGMFKDHSLPQVWICSNTCNRPGVPISRQKGPEGLHFAPAVPGESWAVAGGPGHEVSWEGFKVACNPQLWKPPSQQQQRRNAQSGSEAE